MSRDALTTGLVQRTALPITWVETHAPAANTQATKSKAAGGADVSHVCTAVSFGLAAGASAPTAVTATVSLRDGATGAGTVLATWTIGVAATAGSAQHVTLSGLNIIGSADTAMTLEFGAASGANTLQYVNFTGYSLVTGEPGANDLD